MAKESGWETAENDGWEDADPGEKQIVFAKVGDTFTGKFVGWSETASGIPQAHFTNDEGAFFTNCGWSLKQQLKSIRPTWLVRMEKIGEQDTGQATPMTLMKVQFKRP